MPSSQRLIGNQKLPFLPEKKPKLNLLLLMRFIALREAQQLLTNPQLRSIGLTQVKDRGCVSIMISGRSVPESFLYLSSTSSERFSPP